MVDRVTANLGSRGRTKQHKGLRSDVNWKICGFARIVKLYKSRCAHTHTHIYNMHTIIFDQIVSRFELISLLCMIYMYAMQLTIRKYRRYISVPSYRQKEVCLIIWVSVKSYIGKKENKRIRRSMFSALTRFCVRNLPQINNTEDVFIFNLEINSSRAIVSFNQ